MIDVLMDTVKDFKNVTSITSLFEITLLKLTSFEVVENKPKITQNQAGPAYISPKIVKEEVKPEPVKVEVKEEPVPVIEPVKEEVEIKEEPANSNIQLNELNKFNLYNNTLQYYQPYENFLKFFTLNWGKFLNSKDSWNENYYKIYLNDDLFNLKKNCMLGTNEP